MNGDQLNALIAKCLATRKRLVENRHLRDENGELNHRYHLMTINSS